MVGAGRYKVEIEAHAQRAFRKLPRSAQDRVAGAILALEHTPRPVGCKPMAGRQGHWRIRVGDYRVIYSIRDDVLLILVVEVGHRREVYR